MIASKEISLSTSGFCDICNITPQVEDFVKKSKLKEGIVVVFSHHSTAAITTIEYEEGILRDFCEFLEKLIPQNKTYHHDNTWGDANGFSHLRASLISPSVTIPLKNGKIDLGRWQQIVFCDFDNIPRERTITIQVIGDGNER